MPQWYYTVCFFERCIALLSCHFLQDEHLGFLFFWFVVVVVFDCMQLSTSSKAVLFYLHKGEFGYVMNDKLLRERISSLDGKKHIFLYKIITNYTVDGWTRLSHRFVPNLMILRHRANFFSKNKRKICSLT